MRGEHVDGHNFANMAAENGAAAIIAEKKIEGTSIQHSKKEIEHGLDMLIESFEGILNQFYEEQEMDIVSDVAAIETIMTQ